MELKINLDPSDKQEIAQEVLKVVLPHLKEKATKDETIFTVKTLAKYLQVSAKKIYEIVKLKQIPFYKIGGQHRFKKTEVDRWLESHKVPVVNPAHAVKLVRRFR